MIFWQFFFMMEKFSKIFIIIFNDTVLILNGSLILLIILDISLFEIINPNLRPAKPIFEKSSVLLNSRTFLLDQYMKIHRNLRMLHR